MQEQRDAGIGQMLDRTDAGQDGSRTGLMQDRTDVGQEGCRKGRMQEMNIFRADQILSEGCRTGCA